MIVGAKCLTWAPYTSGGSGAAMVYGTGTAETDKVVRIDMSEERSDVPFHADDHRIDRDNSVNAASLSVEVAKLTATMRSGMLGHTAVGTSATEFAVTDAASPFVGVGFILKDRYKGAESYRAYWYHKVQFSEGQRSFNTKGENLEFQTESLEGEAEAVKLSADGAWEYYTYTEVGTEDAAKTWLNGKAGVS